MVFCIVILHLWGRILKIFPEPRGLAYEDDENTVGRLSQVLNLVSVRETVFKSDGNLDFNMDKTMFLGKVPTTRHVYKRVQHFLQNDPDLQGIANNFTPEMFTEQDIEVLGTPLGTDVYVRDFVAQNCIMITRDVENLEPLTDGFTHFQMIQKTMNTRTQYMSVNITLSSHEQFLSVQHVHVDMVIENAILKKGTRGSFQFWGKDDHDLTVTVIQKTHSRWFWFDTERHHENIGRSLRSFVVSERSSERKSFATSTPTRRPKRPRRIRMRISLRNARR